MNKQSENGIEWTHCFGHGSGFTLNPVRGCKHDCRWRMPDGRIVRCYAKDAKERMSGPGSFERITWHPEVLEEMKSRKKPAGIFIDSMSDLFGNEVQAEWIDQVLKAVKDSPQHFIFSLTKNPTRLPKFSPYPSNMAVGMSAPPTYMYGKELRRDQQIAWFRTGLHALSKCEARIRWVSLEPLSFDLSHIIKGYKQHLHFAVIGAGSDGSKYYQPTESDFRNTLNVLEGLPVFFKGNINHDLANRVAGKWREEFPAIKHQPDLL